MIWKILDVFAENDIINQAKYSVTNDSVSTEGFWTFTNKTRQMTDQTSEIDVINWIKAESVVNDICIIEANLEKQLNNTQDVVKKSWVKPTFSVKI